MNMEWGYFHSNLWTNDNDGFHDFEQGRES